MTEEVWDTAGDDEAALAAELAAVMALRRSLGAHLASYRIAAGISQRYLGRALGKTRSMISKIENGIRGLPAALWRIADDLCHAQGALVAEHSKLVEAEQAYRAHRRLYRRQAQGEQTQTPALALPTWSALISPVVLLKNDDGAWPRTTLITLGGGCGKLAEELMAVIIRVVRALGRRDAMYLSGSVLAAAGLTELNPDEYTRMAQAVESPHRVDTQVVHNLATMLAQGKRLEDTLGPCQVFETFIAQHRLLHRLLTGGCPEQFRRPLNLVDSSMATSIGVCLINMGHPDEARGYCAHARKAAHDAGSPALAAYAAATTSAAAFQLGDTPAALDNASAARSLAARTGDPRLKALAERAAASAYALNGQYGLSMTAYDRAHDFLTTTHGNAPESPAYWFHHGSVDSTRSRSLSQLGKSQEALQAASTALAQYGPTYVVGYTQCQVRLGHALVLSHDITEAARVLGNAAPQAHLHPRLTAEFHTARALMQPWVHTHAVTTLDAQLAACGLLPATTPKPGASKDSL
ncbi:MAG: helix-turn-helix domain-containing protein [Pseudonocardiales bacterium]|nr:helix-turn-helix domain-containing protein [Pseudonocardiales bacterium]